MLNNIIHEGNANQNYNVMPLYTYLDGWNQKKDILNNEFINKLNIELMIERHLGYFLGAFLL